MEEKNHHILSRFIVAYAISYTISYFIGKKLGEFACAWAFKPLSDLEE